MRFFWKIFVPSAVFLILFFYGKPGFSAPPTATVTPTSTPTPYPATHLVILPAASSFAPGVDSGPLTVEVRNALDGPATVLTPVTVSLSSNSGGESSFTQSPGGGRINNFSILPGNTNGVFYFNDYRAESVSLTASTSSLTPGTVPVTVGSGVFAQMQVLWPGESAVPGRPLGVPSGKTGVPTTVTAGSSPAALVRAVDVYFNVVSSVNDSVTLHSSDSSAPPPGLLPLVSGTASKAVTFFTPGNQALTALDGSKAGVSSLLTVLAGAQSTLLNVTHASPVLSTVVLGQPGIEVLTFRFKVQSGTDPVDLTELVFSAKDSAGLTLGMNTAFQSFTLESGSQSFFKDVSGVSSSSVTLGPFALGTFTVAPPADLSVTLRVEISPAASAKAVRLSLPGETAVSASDDTASGHPSTGITSSGDPTGFPMSSGLMVILAADPGKTYGNYPNPFRAGFESTTLEFYLPAVSTVSLTLFDTLGNRVAVLLAGRMLASGLQKVLWDGRNGSGSFVINGVYYAQLDVNGRKFLAKVAVVK